MLKGTTLVVAPLVALMRDQLRSLPPTLPAAMLWGGQPRREVESVLSLLKVCGSSRVFPGLFLLPRREVQTVLCMLKVSGGSRVFPGFPVFVGAPALLVSKGCPLCATVYATFAFCAEPLFGGGQEGRLKVLFVSPERLTSRPLLEALQPLLPLPLVRNPLLTLEP